MQNSDPRKFPLDWKDGLIAFGLACLSLYLYVRTLVPGLIPNDSAEFQTLAFTLGHAHTTGYEVYSLLARLFTLLVPVGDIAYRVNLFSAFLAALTVAFVYLSGRLLSESRWGGALGALALSLAPTFWSQSIIAEVYTAGSAFSGAILMLVLLWRRTRSARYLLAAGLLGGLGIGVHGSNSLFAPAILVLLLLTCPNPRDWWKPALGGAALGLVLMLGAFLLADVRNPPSSSINTIYGPSITRWDLPTNYLDNIGGRFRYLVFAQQWRSAMFVNPGEVIPNNVHVLNDALNRDFSLLARLLIPLGLLSLLARRWRLGVFFLVALIVHGIYTLNYRIGDIYVFFVSMYVYCMPLAAEGAAVLIRLTERLPRLKYPVWQAALGLLLLVLAVAPFAGPSARLVQSGQARWDFMGLPPNSNLLAWRKEITFNVKKLPPNAVVLMDWSNLYGYAYEAYVEQGRNDLQFIEAYPYAIKEGMAISLFDYVKNSLAQGRLVLTLQRYDELERTGLNIGVKRYGFSTFYSVNSR